MPSNSAKYGIKYSDIVDNDSLYVLYLDIYLCTKYKFKR